MRVPASLLFFSLTTGLAGLAPAAGDLGGAGEESPSGYEYSFRSRSDLEHFDIQSGSWSIYSGALTCSSKGQREQIEWRRRLTPRGVLEFEVKCSREFGVLLQGPGEEVEIRFERRTGQVDVKRNKKLLSRRFVEVDRRQPVRWVIAHAPTGLRLQIGDEDALEIKFDSLAAVAWRLSLLSMQSHTSFPRLAIRPEINKARKKAEEHRLSEESDRLEIETVERLLERGQPRQAFERLRKGLRLDEQGGTRRADQSTPVLRLLNQIAQAEPRLLSQEPLASLYEEARVLSSDGQVELYLPFRTGWSARTPRLRQKEGVLFEIRCSSPELDLRIYRYDQAYQYRFGEYPRIHTVGGSSAAMLARARYEDNLVELDEAVALTKPRQASRRIGERNTSEYELHYKPAENEQKERVDAQSGGPFKLHELFVADRGNTHQISVRGSAAALEAAAGELDWLLQNLRFLGH